MSGWRGLALPVGGAALVAVLAIGAVAMLRPAAPLTAAEQADAIAAELRCPTCESLSVADSPSAPAAEIRRQIAVLLAEGRTAAEVKRHFVDRYGEWILLAPSAPLAWLVPPLVIAVGGMALVVWLRRNAPSRAEPPDGPTHADATGTDPATSPSVPARYRDRVREELEAMDA